MSMPMRRKRSACCAAATNGQTAAPPSKLMNSRRLMAPNATPGSRKFFGFTFADVLIPASFAGLDVLPTLARLHSLNLFGLDSRAGLDALNGLAGLDALN